MKQNQPKTVAQRIALGMAELEQVMASGRAPSAIFTVRTVEIPDPAAYGAKQVRATRNRLHVSQTVFAKLLGVSTELVEHWEQGVCIPRAIARRLLDEINRDPAGFLSRHIKTAAWATRNRNRQLRAHFGNADRQTHVARAIAVQVAS